VPRPLAAGDPVRVRFAKWGGSAHWGADVVWLGEDEHGWWAGWPDGTHWERPDASFVSHGVQVGLFPRDRGFAATFYEPVADYEYRVYVDVATVPTLSTDGVIEAVDLDLDVIQRFDGSVLVDDEDEFELHRHRYGYPAEVVSAAERECARLVDEISSGATHFAEELAAGWRARMRALSS
jgi:uncharacterized protein